MRSLIHTTGYVKMPLNPAWGWLCNLWIRPTIDLLSILCNLKNTSSIFLNLSVYWVLKKKRNQVSILAEKFSKCSRLDLDKCDSAFSDQAPLFIDSGHDRHVLVPVFWLCANHICRISWAPLSAGILNYIIRRLKSDTNFHGIWISKFSAHRSTRELMAPWLTLKKLFLTL